MWLNEFVGFFLLKFGGDLLGGVGGHSILLFDIELNKSSGGWCWSFIFGGESWDSVSDSGGPVLKILSFFFSVGICDSWLFSS